MTADILSTLPGQVHICVSIPDATSVMAPVFPNPVSEALSVKSLQQCISQPQPIMSSVLLASILMTCIGNCDRVAKGLQKQNLW